MSDIVDSYVDTMIDTDDLESMTRPLLELLESITGLSSSYLTMIDFDAGLQRILYSRNSSTLQIPEGLTVAWGDTLCKRALESGTLLCSEVKTHWGDSQAARELGISTYLSQPVQTGNGAIFGTLCAASAETVELTPATVNVLAKFARLIGQQIDRELAMQRIEVENRELSAHARVDPLTGLMNRRGMENELQRVSAKIERHGNIFQLAFVDLDHFKTINDQHGHDVGDAFLRHIGRKLSAAVRITDLVARIGGDEFIVVAPEEVTYDLASRLGQATAGRFEFGDTAIDYAGASVGIAHVTAEDADFATALRRADAAMYEAKKARRAAR